MPEALARAAREVLLTADPLEKAAAAQRLQVRWREGGITLETDGTVLPDRPSRPSRPVLLEPSQMPKRGRAGSPRARFALLHALAHIELNAIDLAVDIVGRFGPAMPPAFASDWIQVAAEEALHFNLVATLLAHAGGSYGDLPAHNGLWDSAQATTHSLAARLAVVPLVLEARGLDVTPTMIERFDAANDKAAADVLRHILDDEIRHVRIGNHWFRFIHDESEPAAILAFHGLVRAHFRGLVKPPFNDSARLQAGLTPDWYLPLGNRIDRAETLDTVNERPTFRGLEN